MIPFDYLRFRMNTPPIMKRNVQEQNLFYGSKGFSIWWKVANWLKFLKNYLQQFFYRIAKGKSDIDSNIRNYVTAYLSQR